MKKPFFFAIITLLFVSCGKHEIKNPIELSSPRPTQQIEKVSLNVTQREYVTAGNKFAFKCLRGLYSNNPSTLVFSPLSLQYALAMTANGASGETAEEIVNTLGYGSDIDELNAYCNLLLTELPAVDLNVKVQLADAVMVNDKYPVNNDYKETLENIFFAPVVQVSVSDKDEIVARINDWARRNTDGLIYPFIGANDISNNFSAAILNALYFKARWAGSDRNPMFDNDATLKSQVFYYDGGGEGKVDLMTTMSFFRYYGADKFQIAEIPYAQGKYVMYVLLPYEKGGNGVADLISSLPDISWEELLGNMTTNSKVYLRLPKFESSNRFDLPDVLKSLGIIRAFDPNKAQFDRLFETNSVHSFQIKNVMQKSKIKISEWGTEAASATIVELGETDTGIVYPKVYFYADHPFVYLIAEKTSGVILLEGVFTGK